MQGYAFIYILSKYPYPLKASYLNIIRFSFILSTLLVLKTISFGQGRVVVNEFMPWSGCNTTSEFIELMNFGPGPMNIGCYIVTNGQYAVTIPPNTIIQPGQYFVLSGRNTLLQNCGNIDSLINVDLNWNTCNCTDKTVPTTGDGFMANGGSSNEKVVLLDPNLNVLDAVSRSSSPSSSISITTSTLSGGCTAKTFDLDLMTINYESINISAGIDNSYARRVDGDCGWVKTTNISAHAPNKTGSSSSASYSFSTLSASQCSGSTGSISISVSANDVQALFPMSYTLGFDKDSNNIFNTNDIYTMGVDSSSPSIDINNLAYGRYRLTVGSASGCNLQSFDFFIFNCYGVILSSTSAFLHFEKETTDEYHFSSRINFDKIKAAYLEGGDGRTFQILTPVNIPNSSFQGTGSIIRIPKPAFSYFRLRLVDDTNKVSYSNQVKITSSSASEIKLWPNPASSVLNVRYNSTSGGKAYYRIYSQMGKELEKVEIDVKSGLNILKISTKNLRHGYYQLIIDGNTGASAINYRFMKQ